MTPGNETELAEIIASATGPLAITGGGTKGAQAGGQVLSTAGLRGISLYEPGALTLVAGAGTPLDEVTALLAAENQRLAFEPMDYRPILGTTGTPTLGGMVASNTSGPRRIAVGACRDFMLGVRFVDGAGRIVKNGGRVMKNVTGYDLVRLMSGSWGRLAALTEVALKVLPDVETEAMLALTGLSDKAAIAALAAGMGSPYEVTGAAHDPQKGETLLRIEGFAASVAYRAEALAKLLVPHGRCDIVTDRDTVRERWAAIRDVTAFADRPGDIWRLSMKPSDAPQIVARAEAAGVIYDWAGGLVWLLSDGGDLRARLGNFAGHATLVRGGGDLPRFHPEPAPIATISAGLRAKFDPRGIFNTGVAA
jgi:glycolate oxidase FAD binding subunit